MVKQIFAEQPFGQDHWNVWLTDETTKESIGQIDENNTVAQIALLRKRILEMADINVAQALREVKKIISWKVNKVKELNRRPKPVEKKISKEIVQEIVDQFNSERSFIMVKEWDQLFQFNPTSGLYEECEAEVKMEVELVLETNATPQVVNAIIFKLKNLHLKTLKDLDKVNPIEVPLKSSIFNILTKEKRAYTPKDVFFSKLNVDYDETKTCPKILGFEKEVFQEDDEKILMFRKIVGYCFYRRMPIHKAFMFLGAGDNGKSVALSLIRNMIGETNVSGKSMQDLGGDRFATVQLHQKYANIDADISKITLKGADHFKKLTGEDLVTGQYKGKDGFDFISFAKLLFSANEIPGVSEDTSERFYSRWDFLEFNRVFLPEEQNHSLLSELTCQEEMNGYCAIVLDELVKLLDRKKFCEMNDKERKEIWYKHGESSAKFCTEKIESTVGGFVTCEILYQRYKNYCEANPGTHLESETKLYQVVRQKYPGATRTSTSTSTSTGEKISFWVMRNIRFKENTELIIPDSSSVEGSDGKLLTILLTRLKNTSNGLSRSVIEEVPGMLPILLEAKKKGLVFEPRAGWVCLPNQVAPLVEISG